MRLGLFLTPGAARTAYQVGAVRTLVDEGGLHFDVIAASSVGALNAAFTATGQVDRLADLWAGWRDRDIFGIDGRAIARGAVWWAANLMHNRPQRTKVIDRYLSDASLPSGVRLRINLANLTHGGYDVVEWPGTALALADGVDASVAVPAAIRPHEIDGVQYADGLTVDGFPLEHLLLETGIDRAFVVGVSPRGRRPGDPSGPLASLIAAAEWNQYTEVTRGVAESERVNERARRWERAQERARAVAARVHDRDDRIRVAAAIDECFERNRHGRRLPVEVVAILPDEHTPMFFTSYRPERSRRLLEQGRRDARRIIASL